MTIVAGIVDPKARGVWLGADSATVTDWRIELARDPKVFTVRAGDETLGIAIAGSWRFAHLLRYKVALPEIPRGGDIAEWMHVDFADAITVVFEDVVGERVAEERWKDIKDGCALVAIRGRLFEIEAEGTAVELTDGYSACGTGGEFAVGAFAATEQQPPADRIKTALKAGIKHGRDVRPPLHFRFFAKGGRR